MRTDQLKYIAPLIENEINNNVISGASMLILKDNKEIYRDVFGYANRETKQIISKDTIYRLYSMTKPITTVAAMILYERGLLDLNAPVSRYLDGFKNQKVFTKDGLVDVNGEATIQDMLNMTSGVVYPDGSYEVGSIMQKLYDEVYEKSKNGEAVNTVDFCNLIGQVPLEFHPKESWRYGASADIVGGIIEIISKKQFSTFLKEEIFEPLGMVDTDFYVPSEKLSRFAEMYEYKNDVNDIIPCTWNFLGLGDYLAPPAFESGGAGLVSTIDDYEKFTSMLLNGGTYQGVRIISRKTVEYISQNQLDEKQATGYNWDQLKGYGYGNLMRVLMDPKPTATTTSVGEYGWDGWAGDYFFIDPKEHLVMVYMIQKCGGSNHDLMKKFRAIIYSAIE